MALDNPFMMRAKMELAYFSFYARLKQRQTGGAGVVLRFQRVRPRRIGGFQPNKAQEITPRFLDRAIRALKRWKYEIVTMDEVCQRAISPPSRGRFAALTFDVNNVKSKAAYVSKGFDAFMITVALILVGATMRILLPFLPGSSRD